MTGFLNKKKSVWHCKEIISSKPKRFTESVIREMTRLSLIHGAINLSQGFPDFPAPQATLMKSVAEGVFSGSLPWI